MPSMHMRLLLRSRGFLMAASHAERTLYLGFDASAKHISLRLIASKHFAAEGENMVLAWVLSVGHIILPLITNFCGHDVNRVLNIDPQ